MNTSQIFEYTEKLVFFNDFTNEEKAEVASFTQNVIGYPEGNLIIQQGSNDPSLHILFDGEVVLRKEEKPGVDITSLLPGSIFGTIPELPVTPRNQNVFAVKESVVLQLDRPMMDELSPNVTNKFNIEFIKVLFRRLSETNERVTEERAKIMGITGAYGKIKTDLDAMPSLPDETRITSNLMYNQLKDICSPMNNGR